MSAAVQVPEDWSLGEVIVELSTRAHVLHDEPNDAIETIAGRILIARDEGPTEVGTLECGLLHPEVAEDLGEDLGQVCDAESEEWAEIHKVFFRGYDVRPNLAERFEMPPGSSLLLVDSVKVKPEFRGRGVGLAAVGRVIDVFAMRSALVVCRPFPMQFSSRERRGNPRLVKTGRDDSGRDQEAATRALQKYWSRLAFRRVGRSPYYALSPYDARPWHRPGFFGEGA